MTFLGMLCHPYCCLHDFLLLSLMMGKDNFSKELSSKMRKIITEKRRGNYGIHEGLSVKQIDAVLKDKYEYGLIHYVESLKTICFSNIMRSVPPPSYSNMPAKIKSLQSAKSRIIKSFDSYYNLMPFPKHEGENSIINRYKLKHTLDIIDAEINFYRNFQKDDNKGGPKVKPITILTYIWSHFLKDKRGVHWDQIEGLLDWFLEHLKKGVYRNILEKQIPDWETIKRGVLRLRKSDRGNILDFTYVDFFKNYSKSKDEQNRTYQNLFNNS